MCAARPFLPVPVSSLQKGHTTLRLDLYWIESLFPSATVVLGCASCEARLRGIDTLLSMCTPFQVADTLRRCKSMDVDLVVRVF